MEDKVSIIVPIYNCEKYLNKCLESLYKQTYSNIEIILVNDGSTDESEKICMNYEQKNNKFKYYLKPNSGAADTRNYGLKVATGDYILFVDSDDYIDNNYVEIIYSKLIKNKADIVVTGLTEVSEDGNLIKRILYSEYDKIIFLKDFLKDFINYAYFTCVKTLFKKEILTQYFNINLKFGEDIFFAYNLFKNSKICYVANTGYYYVQNNQSITHQYDLSYLHKYMEDNIYIYNEILNDNQDLKIVIENRLLTKLNLALQKLILSENYNFKDFKKYCVFYLYRLKNIQISEINYISFIGKFKVFLLKYKFIFGYYIFCKILNKIKIKIKKF